MGVQQPETRYAKSGDVSIAYQVTGDGPYDVVYVPGFVSNVELAWKLDDVFMERANAYTRLMFENKQIRQVPDLNRHITKQFM